MSLIDRAYDRVTKSNDGGDRGTPWRLATVLMLLPFLYVLNLWRSIRGSCSRVLEEQ